MVVVVGGVRPDLLINRDLRHEIRGRLMKLREKMGGEVHKKQDEAIQLQEQLDRIIESLVDKKDELEGLEAKVTGAMEQFSEIKDVSPPPGSPHFRLFGAILMNVDYDGRDVFVERRDGKVGTGVATDAYHRTEWNVTT